MGSLNVIGKVTQKTRLTLSGRTKHIIRIKNVEIAIKIKLNSWRTFLFIRFMLPSARVIVHLTESMPDVYLLKEEIQETSIIQIYLSIVLLF